MTAGDRSGVAMPEWLARHDRTTESWTVEAGSPTRGDAWTNAHDRKMRVPVGGDETNRVIRAHEMMHARVSPMFANAGASQGISIEALRAAEELRVNLLTQTAGFDVDLLVDGSERPWGERAAKMRDYASLVTAVVAMAGTKGATAFVRGVRNIDPELAKAIREVEKGALKFWKRDARRIGDKRQAELVGSTQPVAPYEDGEMMPAGYARFTLPLAKFIDNAIDALTPPSTGDDTDAGMPSDEHDPVERVKRAAAGRYGRFANLLLDQSITLDRSVTGRFGRKRIATNMGRNPRHIGRMLTDPQRRVFDRTVRGTGGIIVIDQSGSMALPTEAVEQMMEASPGCTIIGYSHRPGCNTTPNAWVIAKGGRRASELPKGNGGNGVDGPVLRFAASLARKGEQIVWLCDGVVTDGSDDHCYENLSKECVRLVYRHNIHMTDTVTETLEAVKQMGQGKRLRRNYTGPLRSHAARMGLTN